MRLAPPERIDNLRLQLVRTVGVFRMTRSSAVLGVPCRLIEMRVCCCVQDTANVTIETLASQLESARAAIFERDALIDRLKSVNLAVNVGRWR